MRQKIIIGNWKMNKNANETKAFLAEFNHSKFIIRENLIYGLAVPFINIPILNDNKADKLAIASQDVSMHEKGAYTGEVAPSMLIPYGVKYAIVGHSERRQYHNETSDVVNKKAANAIANKITPIICVGETLAEYESKKSKAVVKTQVLESTKGLDLSKVVIAYEPVWAIGTGKTATLECAQEMCHYIRSLTTNDLLIQYGGSVNAKNINELLTQPDIDGALVGGASLEAESFIALIKKY